MFLPAIDPDADFVLSAVNGDIILTYYAVPIPEPSAGLLLSAGFVVMMISRRRARAGARG